MFQSAPTAYVAPPRHRSLRRWCAALCVLSLGLVSCGDAGREPEASGPLRTAERPILIADLPELGGDYPDVLIQGLSRQLIDEMNCIEPGVLVEFEIAQEPGYLYTENNIPLMLRPEALEAAEAVAAIEGDYLTITSGYRDVGMQYYDYLRGQRFGFLAGRPGGSRHQAGQAIDVKFNAFWLDNMLDYGWSWPLGDRDRPHFEWRDIGPPDLRVESVRAFQRLWNRHHPDEYLEEDGVFGPVTESKLAVTPAEGFEFGGCDLDMDGFADPTISGDDCDDERSDVYPGAEEICGDGVDQDCDGADLPCEEPPPMDAGQDAASTEDVGDESPSEQDAADDPEDDDDAASPGPGPGDEGSGSDQDEEDGEGEGDGDGEGGSPFVDGFAQSEVKEEGCATLPGAPSAPVGEAWWLWGGLALFAFARRQRTLR